MAVTQGIFFFVLYLVGVFFALLFKRRLPVGFLCISGFFWGVLEYVLLAMFFLVSTIPYTFVNMTIGIGALLIAAFYFHVRMGTWRLTSRDLAWLGGTIVVFVIAEIILLTYVPIWFSGDSYSLIKIGRWIGNIGFQANVPVGSPEHGYGVFSGIADYGVFVPIVQSASVFLGIDYISVLNPLLALSLAANFIYLGQRALVTVINKPAIRILYSIVFASIIFSDRMVIRQSFYLHTNPVSAVYFFIAAICFWLVLREKNFAWLVFAILSLTGFNLTRTEAPLYAVILLILIVCERKIPYRVQLVTLLPFLGFAVGWYTWLSFRSASQVTLILTPAYALAIASLLASVAGLAFLTKWKWFENKVVPWLPGLVISGLGIFVVVAFVLQPEHMFAGTKAILRNLFLSDGRWGITWYIALGLLFISGFRSSVPFKRLFTVTIACFFLLVIALGALRTPYHLGWSDSANRMMIHILPVVFFFFLLNFSYKSNKKVEKRIV